MPPTYIRKINKKTKYSYTINLPKEIIDKFHWQDNQKLELKIFGKDKILIKDWQPKPRK